MLTEQWEAKLKKSHQWQPCPTLKTQIISSANLKNFDFFLLEIKGTDRKNSIMWNNVLLDHPFLWELIQSVFYSKSCRLFLNMKVSYLQGLQIHVKRSFREFEKVKFWKELKDYSVSLAWKSFAGVARRKENLSGNIILSRVKLDVNWVKFHAAVILL